MLPNEIKRLDLKVPPQLAYSLGYLGNSRWVYFFWETEPVGQPICADGTKIYIGNKIAWKILVSEIGTSPSTWGFYENEICLLLDRHQKVLYCADKETMTELLKQPQNLKLLSMLKAQVVTNYCVNLLTVLTSGVVVAAACFGIIGGIKLLWPIFDSELTHQLQDSVDSDAQMAKLKNTLTVPKQKH